MASPKWLIIVCTLTLITQMAVLGDGGTGGDPDEPGQKQTSFPEEAMGDMLLRVNTALGEKKKVDNKEEGFDDPDSYEDSVAMVEMLLRLNTAVRKKKNADNEEEEGSGDPESEKPCLKCEDKESCVTKPSEENGTCTLTGACWMIYDAETQLVTRGCKPKAASSRCDSDNTHPQGTYADNVCEFCCTDALCNKQTTLEADCNQLRGGGGLLRAGHGIMFLPIFIFFCSSYY